MRADFGGLARHMYSHTSSQGGVDFGAIFLYRIDYELPIGGKLGPLLKSETIMTNPSSLELDIASLLCARLCHDLAGPVGAVNNGAELLNEGGAESMDDARELISSCAGQAVRRLRFFRLAYGSTYGSMDWSGAMQTSEAMLSDAKISYTWDGYYDGAEGTDVAGVGKLALNMILLAANCMPRGGTLEFRAAGDVNQPDITLCGQGPMIILDETALTALADGCRQDGAAVKDLNARFVQHFLTGLLAADFGLAVNAAATGEGQFEVSTSTG